MKNVLIIDDEKSVIKSCARALEKKGYECYSALNASTARKMLKRREYGVILLDIGLPDASGRDFMDEIKEKNFFTEIVMLTGKATVEDAVICMKKGAYDFITKPFGVNDLRGSVEKAMEKAGLKTRVSELERIASISNVSGALCRLTGLEELIKTICREAEKALGADYSELKIYDNPFASDNNCMLEEFGSSQDAVFKDDKRVLFAPLKFKEKYKGFLRAEKKTGSFNQIDLSVASVFAGQAAVAVENSKIYDSLKEVDRMKDIFLTNISHEIKTPLQSILGSSEILHKRYGTDRMTSLLINNALRLKEIMEEILDYKKFYEGNSEMEFHMDSLQDTVSQAIKEIIPKARKKKIVIYKFYDHLDSFRHNKEAVKKAVYNILDNAIKYTPGEEKVSVSIRRQGDCAAVKVKDRGPGISDSEKEKIYDRFHQRFSSSSFDVKEQGIGLGLAVAENIARSHGGYISFDSSDRGSIFSLLIPIR